MTKIQVDYSSAKRKFPKEVAEIESKIRKSKSKHNEDDFDSFTWHYDWGTMVKGNSFQDIINGTAHKEQQQRNAMSVDDQVKDVLSRSHISLMATKGRSCIRSDVLTSNPIEVKEFYRELYQNDKDERDRFESLPQAEQQKKTEDLLKELSGYGGFRALKIK